MLLKERMCESVEIIYGSKEFLSFLHTFFGVVIFDSKLRILRRTIQHNLS